MGSEISEKTLLETQCESWRARRYLQNLIQELCPNHVHCVQPIIWTEKSTQSMKTYKRTQHRNVHRREQPRELETKSEIARPNQLMNHVMETSKLIGFGYYFDHFFSLTLFFLKYLYRLSFILFSSHL